MYKQIVAHLKRYYSIRIGVYRLESQTPNLTTGDEGNNYSQEAIIAIALPKRLDAAVDFARILKTDNEMGQVVETADQFFLIELDGLTAPLNTESRVRYKRNLYRVSKIEEVEEFNACVIRCVLTSGDASKVYVTENVASAVNFINNANAEVT